MATGWAPKSTTPLLRGGKLRAAREHSLLASTSRAGNNMVQNQAYFFLHKSHPSRNWIYFKSFLHPRKRLHPKLLPVPHHFILCSYYLVLAPARCSDSMSHTRNICSEFLFSDVLMKTDNTGTNFTLDTQIQYDFGKVNKMMNKLFSLQVVSLSSKH